jgi:hypothetical protein
MIPRGPELLISLSNSSSVKAHRTRFFWPRSSTFPTNFRGLALIRPTRFIQLRKEAVLIHGPPSRLGQPSLPNQRTSQRDVPNRHMKDKIRQQLQVLRDAGLLLHVGRSEWRLA